MSEIFVKEHLSKKLSYSGERFTEGHSVETDIEHYHRYFFARAYCKDKVVLDIASGEGYGSALLAQVAASVIGVDISEEAIAHAQAEHNFANLKYMVGDAYRIPLPDHSIDVVVSFETLEHIQEHDLFMQEVKRVLRADGCLIISTPDKDIYSAPGTIPNPYHVHELTQIEFHLLCEKYFKEMQLLKQQVFVGSALLTSGEERKAPLIFESRDENYIESSDNLLRAPYLLCIVSDVKHMAVQDSFFMNEIAKVLQPPISCLNQELELAHQYIQHLEQEISAKNGHIQHLEQDIRSKEQQIALLEHQ